MQTKINYRLVASPKAESNGKQQVNFLNLPTEGKTKGKTDKGLRRRRPTRKLRSVARVVRRFNRNVAHVKELWSPGDGFCFEHSMRLTRDRTENAIAGRQLWVNNICGQIRAGNKDTIRWVAQELQHSLNGNTEGLVPRSVSELFSKTLQHIQKLDQEADGIRRDYAKALLDIEGLGQIPVGYKQELYQRHRDASPSTLTATLKTESSDPQRPEINVSQNSVNQLDILTMLLHANTQDKKDAWSAFLSNKDILINYVRGYYLKEDPSMNGYVKASRHDGIPHWFARKHQKIIVILCPDQEHGKARITAVFRPEGARSSLENVQILSFQGGYGKEGAGHFSKVEAQLGFNILGHIEAFEADSSAIIKIPFLRLPRFKGRQRVKPPGSQTKKAVPALSLPTTHHHSQQGRQRLKHLQRTRTGPQTRTPRSQVPGKALPLI